MGDKNPKKAPKKKTSTSAKSVPQATSSTSAPKKK
ncbi:MAG: hypothetical protein K0S61_2747 [Anaerocolumna sp.]|jgi:hypothetical protein|nr:hypothetical protein [Anaerocolumna sp.]